MPSAKRATSPPSFFLAEDASPGSPRLCPEDERHATRVLRLGVGDALVALDGRGGRHVLRVRSMRRGSLELEQAGPSELVPAPGEAGADLPWFEVAVSWPRRNQVEG